MKILLVGYHNPHYITITEYIEGGIKALGQDLIVYDDRKHIIPGRIRYRVPWLHALDLKHINNRLLSIAKREKPEMMIVSGGVRILSETIKAIKKHGIITVLWTTDPPINFQPILDAAPFYDHIFCQGSETVELLTGKGITGAHCLPVACDPYRHRHINLTAEERRQFGNDLVFVGSYYQTREQLFEKLINFDFSIWGTGWNRLAKESPLWSHIKAIHTPVSVWQKIYNASKIILATHFQDLTDTFPVYQASPRIFEALACGAFVLCDNQKDVFNLFKDGEHLVSFDSSEDLLEKIRYYLSHPNERLEIAEKGRQEVLAHHTFRHRIESLLKTAFGNKI